ncbi:MAG: hypothetical protein IJU41_06590 [Clostridia bacterium]|nr:hypothetical protein [Clostridia bacterium]
MKKRFFAGLLALWMLAGLFGIAAIEILDPTPYLHDDGYQVILDGFQRTFEKDLRPGAGKVYRAQISVKKYDEANETYEDFKKQYYEIRVPELQNFFFAGKSTTVKKTVNADGNVTKDESKSNEQECRWDYELDSAKSVYIEGSNTGSYSVSADFEFSLKNIVYSVFNTQSEYPTPEAYADSIHWQGGENGSYHRSVEKKGGVTIVKTYTGGPETTENTDKRGFYGYYVINENGIVQEYKSENLAYRRTNRHEGGQIYYIYPIAGLPSHYFVIRFDYGSMYETEVPEDTSKILPEYKAFTEDYTKAKATYDAVFAELESLTIAATPGQIITPGGAQEEVDDGKLHFVTETPAAETAGEDAGTSIPAVIILGVLGAGAALAGAVSGDGGEDKKKRPTFKMYINKDFGSQLKKGEAPRPVCARIAEVTPDGNEIPRPDLTESIRVFTADDSLVVSDGGMRGGYRCAMVSVPDMEEPKPEGIVSFYYEGEGGSYTQNVIFNIVVPGIKFFQSNLTLPAGKLDDPEFLPFEVTDMGEKYDIELSYNGENYAVDLTDCEAPEAKNIHYAVFMETSKETYPAGVYTEGWLNVKVKNERQELKASLKIIRMGMGLCVPIGALNCYRVPKKESAGKEMKAMTPADFETSTTAAPAYLLYYDAEDHEVRQEAAFPDFSFAPLEGETEEKKKQIKEALAAIKITPKLTKIEDHVASYTLVCEGGFLDAPTRYIVRMTCTCSAVIGKAEDALPQRFTCERDVLLRSQPSRVVAGVRDNHELDKYDDQIAEMLFGIKKIVFEHYLSQLFPLYNMIDRMVSGFDRAYGYDPYQVAKVVDVWERFQSGQLKGIGSEVNTYGVADELEALAAATRSWDGWSGIVLRLSLDVMTGGASEVILVALDVNRAAMDYRKETGGNGTALGYFKAMALPLALGSIGVVAAVGRGAGRVIGDTAKRLMPKQTAALLKKAQTIKNTAAEMASLAAKDAKNALGYVASKIPQGAKNATAKIGEMVNTVVEKVNKFDPKLELPKANQADSVIKAGANKGKAAADAAIAKAQAAPKSLREKCIDAAGNAANKEGEILYNELIAAKKALQSNPTSGAAQLRYNQAIMEFKASHAAIEHANAVLPGEQLTMRAIINEDIEATFASRVQTKYADKVAVQCHTDPGKVKFDRATGHTDASKKIGRDIDWTPKVVTEKDGVKYINQSTADKLLEESVRETVEETCGKEFAERFAKEGGFARKLDQTACTVQSKEYFAGGLDTVKQITDKKRMGEYMGAEKARSVADTLRYKGAHPYAEGARLEKEVLGSLSDTDTAKLLKELEDYAKADAATAKTMQLSENAQKLKQAYALMEEGVYQPAKYNKLVFEKEWTSLKGGYTETLGSVDYASARILDRGCGQALPAEMMQRSEAWVGERITLSEARKACEYSGTTLEKAINGVGDAFEKIDAKLGYGTHAEIANAARGGFGVGGAISNLSHASEN